MIPISQGRELYKAAAGPKQFMPIRDDGHNWVRTRTYIEKLDWFIETLNSPMPENDTVRRLEPISD